MEYPVAKFSSSKGAAHYSSQEGDLVKVALSSPKSPKLNSMTEADPRDKTTLQVRLAAITTCTVSVGDKAQAVAELPIFELGRTVNIANGVGVRK